MKTIIHVNQHIIKRNAKEDRRDPVLTVKQGKENTYAHAVEIDGPCKVIYSPDDPLSCGARVWIETNSSVKFKGVIKKPKDLKKTKVTVKR